jgi:hypothetical protein
MHAGAFQGLSKKEQPEIKINKGAGGKNGSGGGGPRVIVPKVGKATACCFVQVASL